MSSVLQAQGYVALHRVAHHDVLPAGLGQQLQHGAGLDVLEVERQPLALVFALARVDDGHLGTRSNLKHVVTVALVSELFEVSRRRDHDARAVRAARHVERADRRGEVHHVEALQVFVGHRGVREIDHDPAAFLLEARLHAWIAGCHEHAACAVGATPEVHLLHGRRLSRSRLSAGRRRRRSRPGLRHRTAVPDHHVHRVA
jgi:hypothetical protein